PRPVDLRKRNRNQILPLAPDQLALRDVLAQVLLDLPANDVAEAAMVWIDSQRHLSSPLNVVRPPDRRTAPSSDRTHPGADPSPSARTLAPNRPVVGSYTPRRSPCALAGTASSSIPSARVSTASGLSVEKSPISF